MRYRLLGNFHMSGSACGTPRFAVADGTLTLHGKAPPTQVVSGLSHDKDKANGHIDKLLDKEKVDNQLPLRRVFNNWQGRLPMTLTVTSRPRPRRKLAISTCNFI